MSLAETKPQKADTSTRHGLKPSAKIVEFKNVLQARTDAMNGWAHDRADAVRSAAERRPFMTAGVTAGIALVGGVALGLLLSGQMAGLKRTLDTRNAFAGRARSFLRR